MPKFKLVSDYVPRGDQPRAIQELTDGILRGDEHQTLLGVTGSGKTYVMSNVIANAQRPTLVISHNKTLAAQLYGEFRGFFPENAVEYFVSYYDYYQPEAYRPTTDTYIEKAVDINDDIDRLRLRTTSALLERRDVVVVASVSCIYGIGSPDDYREMHVILDVGERIDRDELLRRLVDIHYTRNDYEFARGTFRVRGDVVEVLPAYEEIAFRIELFGDEVEAISVVEPLTGKVLEEKERGVIYPARHFVTTSSSIEAAYEGILRELDEQLAKFQAEGKLLEAQRLESRTKFDVEMMREVGFCNGIENYSRHLTGRKPGQRPAVLIDYFPEDYLVFIDESHVTIPQIRGMWHGDRSRKDALVEYGFRLPSAYDNRPLYFHEFEEMMSQVICVSATPAEYELEKSQGVVVEQVIRPTGLMDPKISVRPARGQVDDLLEEIRLRVEREERVLVTTLTKRTAEDLAEYLDLMGVRTKYLHSEIVVLERIEILRELRLGEFDVLVGINLLREGLDLPEVSLVAILDADREGFLRSERSLIQTAGRAARNEAGEVILYADGVTDSMRRAIDETERRRQIQQEYNEEHGITPETIRKSVEDVMLTTSIADARTELQTAVREPAVEYVDALDRETTIEEFTKRMQEAAANLEFEKAAALRDEIERMKAET